MESMIISNKDLSTIPLNRFKQSNKKLLMKMNYWMMVLR